MLRHLLKPAQATASHRFALPPGERAYAIGDVHGRLDLLDALLTQIDADNLGRGKADTWLIFLGDLIDRGPASRGVLARAMDLAASPRACIFLMGNHEEMLLRVWEGQEQAAPPFLQYGGDALLHSYGLDVPRDVLRSWEPAQIISEIKARVPQDHIEFIKRFGTFCRMGDYVFVHAGIRPGIAVDDQDPIDMRWIRGAFTKSKADHEAMIVHGHSISASPEVRANRIGIDTGAYASERLTAVGLQGRDYWFLST